MINIKYGNDFITIDLRLNQLRYIHDYKNSGIIEFVNIYNDLEGLDSLIKREIKTSKKCIRDEILSEMGILLNIKKMRMINK